MENLENKCSVSEWSEWGDCTNDCGGGIQYSYRTPLSDNYSEYECGSLTRTQECNTQNCPNILTAFLKHIDYKLGKFYGWTDEEVENACDNKKNILKVTDTIKLRYGSEQSIENGIYLDPDSTNRFEQNFNITSSGQFIFADGKFLKLKNRQIVEIVECDLYGGIHDNLDDESSEWCGESFSSESYICLTGAKERIGVLNTSISDRYFYNVKSPSTKTEWKSKNNLLTIKYISAEEEYNIVKQNIWAVVDSMNKLYYYTPVNDNEKSCPPRNTDWIPVHPMNSNYVTLVESCNQSKINEVSCDLKDAFNARLFNLNNETELQNNVILNSEIEQKTNLFKNDFIEVLTRGSGLPTDTSEVYLQNFKGHFNVNELVTDPIGVGVKKYFDTKNEKLDVIHYIDFPFVKPVDLVSLKLMSVLNTPGAFDIQVYSIEKQRWVLLEKVSHFKNNQQIVTEIKNEEYNSFDPPIDNSDCIVESIVGIRIFVGNYDYETGIKKPIILETDNQGLMIHSLRAEVRDTKKCVPDEVKYLNEIDVLQITKKTKNTNVKLYETFTEIVGDLCVGNLVYGNYKYDGDVDEIYYTWSVNDILVSDSRHIDTTGFNVGDVLTFEVTFTYGGGQKTRFSATGTLKNCKTELILPNKNFAIFYYSDKKLENENVILTGYSDKLNACDSSDQNLIKIYWNGNLMVGTKISTESSYQTNELISSKEPYFVCREENCVIKISKNLEIAEIDSCPPKSFMLEAKNEYALSYNDPIGTEVGSLVGHPVNKNIKYTLTPSRFGIHNNLFILSGFDTKNKLANVNLLLNGDIKNIGDEAKLTITASGLNGTGSIEKNITLNIKKSELIRYAPCPRISISGFTCDILNGNYGGIFNKQTDTNPSEYQYHDEKMLFRTTRKYTDGFLLDDGTVEIGAGYVYSELKWSNDKNQWQLFIYSEEDENLEYTTDYMNGKLCAFSYSQNLDCPIDVKFEGISPSFGVGETSVGSLIDFGDDFNSDCTDLNIC